MKFSYAIFDMDGLMFDTENLFVRAFEEAIGPEIGYRFSREKMKQLTIRRRWKPSRGCFRAALRRAKLA